MLNKTNKQTILKEEQEENTFAIYLEDEPINYIPAKDSGYTLDLEKSSCNNGVELDFDYNTWTIRANYSNYESTDHSRVKCSLYFRVAEEYTISYDLNGGTGDIVSQIKIEGKTLVLTEQVPTKENYTFLGWSTTKGGNIEYRSGAEFEKNEDTTLYAVYGINTLYDSGNQYTVDTGGWTYTKQFYSTGTTLENDTVSFTTQYIEWDELGGFNYDVTPITGYYGDGYFEHNNFVTMEGAKQVVFQYTAPTAIRATVNNEILYPAIYFSIVNESDQEIKTERVYLTENQPELQTFTLDLSGIDDTKIKIRIRATTTATAEIKLTFRIYKVFMTY